MSKTPIGNYERSSPLSDIRDLLCPSLATLRFLGIAVHKCKKSEFRERCPNNRFDFFKCYHFVVVIVLFTNFLRLSLTNFLEPWQAYKYWGNYYAILEGSRTVGVVNSITYSASVSMHSFGFFLFSLKRSGFYKRLHKCFQETQRGDEAIIGEVRWLTEFRKSQKWLLLFFGLMTLISTCSQMWLVIATLNVSDGCVASYFAFVLNCLGALYSSVTWCYSLHWFVLLSLLVRKKFEHVNRIMYDCFDDKGIRCLSVSLVSAILKRHYHIIILCRQLDIFFKYYVGCVIAINTPLLCFVLFQFMWIPMETMAKTITGLWAFGLAAYLCILLFNAAAIPETATSIGLKLYESTLLTMETEKKLMLVSGLTNLQGQTVGFTFLNMFVVTYSSIINLASAVFSYIIIISQQLATTN